MKMSRWSVMWNGGHCESVLKPKMVTDCNHFMGAVDSLDGSLHPYDGDRKIYLRFVKYGLLPNLGAKQLDNVLWVSGNHHFHAVRWKNNKYFDDGNRHCSQSILIRTAQCIPAVRKVRSIFFTGLPQNPANNTQRKDAVLVIPQIEGNILFLYAHLALERVVYALIHV